MALIDSQKLDSVDIDSIDLSRSPKAQELRNLLDEAFDLGNQIKELEAKKKQALNDADALRKKLRLPGKITSSLWTTVLKLGISKTIKADKLLERGVPIQVIEDCTQVSTYETFYVQGRKSDKDKKEGE